MSTQTFSLSSFLSSSAANEQDDEEWGWGDDDEDHGDVELASSMRDDNSVHKRRSTSHDSLPSGGTPAQTMPAYKKSSPRVNTQVKSHIPTDHQHHIPKLPKVAAHAPISSSSTGMSLKPKPGMALSSPAPVPPAPASAPPTNNNIAGFGQMQGLAITSLGPKRTAPAAAPKKAVAPAPSPEDDIFASMGLAAKPKFVHAPAAPPKPAATTTMSSSRWNNAPAPAAPVASKLISSGNSLDGGGDDDNWDDDGDLDDLLDD